ncbi:peptidase family M48-domain-containing protein [Mycotypha africana]|uniref:peptidase family M48-domain-containing protein n=1 Tax=Mycotypha africana TaxID=64632 RepID=UPI00230191A7|nr:peptidase family M48-domain-containing protein [Mycotypha africana]KAI8981646.1 peptidase family M48-domain-containing protein [Mycotypha africana]
MEKRTALAIEAYQQLMAAYAGRILPPNHYYSRMVKRVAERLIRVSGMEHLHWEFYVVEAREANAFVLPGGKVFVFTGILPICKNEDGLAAVLGHEIAHELARHTAERFSYAKILYAMNFTLYFLGLHSMMAKDFAINYLMMMPFSRKCETEADDIGLQLMSLACFDPREAVGLWERMEAVGASKLPQFFNTHPSHENRFKNLSKKVRNTFLYLSYSGLGLTKIRYAHRYHFPLLQLPAALQKRAESDCQTEMSTFDRFRKEWVRW